MNAVTMKKLATSFQQMQIWKVWIIVTIPLDANCKLLRMRKWLQRQLQEKHFAFITGGLEAEAPEPEPEEYAIEESDDENDEVELNE